MQGKIAGIAQGGPGVEETKALDDAEKEATSIPKVGFCPVGEPGWGLPKRPGYKPPALQSPKLQPPEKQLPVPLVGLIANGPHNKRPFCGGAFCFSPPAGGAELAGLVATADS